MLFPSTGSPDHGPLIHPKYRPDIDGLRAVAVLSVVAFHAAPNWVTGGFVGVDIFFVISGFLISTIIFENLAAGSFSFRDFYARRVKRIFPALVLVLSATGAFGWYVLFEDEYSQLGNHIAAGAGFVSNLVLWSEAGYFDASADSKPLLHLWSLGIEEQFYIAWPLIAYLAWKRRGGMVVAALALLVGSFALNAATVSTDPVAVFYSPVTRVWELSIGSALAWRSHQLQRLGSSHIGDGRNDDIRSIVGMALIGAAIVLLNKRSMFPGWWALLPTLGTMLLIQAGPGAWLNRTVLSRRLIVWFGLISYPLYLWHWPLLSFGRIIESRDFSIMMRLVAVLVAIVLAWLTLILLEKPIRRKDHNRRKVLALAGMMLIVFGAGFTISHGFVLPRSAGPELGKLVRAKADWEFPTPASRPYPYRGHTFRSYEGNGSGPVLVMGDSIAQQYAARVEHHASQGSATLRTVIFATEGGCPPIPGVFREDQPVCPDSQQAIVDIAQENYVDTVVIAACWYCYFVYATSPDSETPFYYLKEGQKTYFRDDDKLDDVFAALEALLRSLALKKKVILVLSTPSGPSVNPNGMYQGSRLSQVTRKSTAPLTLDGFLHEFGPYRDRLEAIAARTGVDVIDPLEELCTQDNCTPFTTTGDPIFKDSVHLRASFVRDNVRYLDHIFLEAAK